MPHKTNWIMRLSKPKAQIFVFFPAISAGLSDGFSVCALAALMIFVIWLSVISTTYKRFFVLGVFYMLSVFLTTYFFVVSSIASKLDWTQFVESARHVYSALAMVGILTGALHFFDWLRLKKTNRPARLILKSSADLFESQENDNSPNIFVWFVQITTAAALGFLMTFLSTACPISPYLYDMIMISVWQGNTRQLLWSLGLYSLALILPLVIVFCLFNILIRKTRNDDQDRINQISLMKILYSAILLGLGIGLFILFQ